MRHTAAVLLLAAALALTGCGSSGDASKAAANPSASATPSADPAPAFMSAVEAAHLNSYATGIPAWQELSAFPPKWCAGLEQGHSVAWLFDMSQGGLYPIGEDWGTEKSDAYQVLVLGVKAYCPARLAGVQEELRALGVY